MLPEVERTCRRWLKNVTDDTAREKLEHELFSAGEKSDTKTGAFVHLYTHEWLTKAGFTCEIPEPPDLLALREEGPQFFVETTHRGPSAVVDGYWDKELWIDESSNNEPIAVEIPERNVVLECLRKKQNKYQNLGLPLLLVCGITYRPYDFTEAVDDLKLWFRELQHAQNDDERFQRQISGFLFAHPMSPSLRIIPHVWYIPNNNARHPFDDSLQQLVHDYSKVVDDYLAP